MAPLATTLISNELNLIFALFAGIAFGFLLEQSGLSSSKKLAGLFYGYDFTVLRFFFTAGITAMVGVLLLTQLGLLDAGKIHINPTFLWSAPDWRDCHGNRIYYRRFLVRVQEFVPQQLAGLMVWLFCLELYWGYFLLLKYIPYSKKSILPESWGPVLIKRDTWNFENFICLHTYCNCPFCLLFHRQN